MREHKVHADKVSICKYIPPPFSLSLLAYRCTSSVMNTFTARDADSLSLLERQRAIDENNPFHIEPRRIYKVTSDVQSGGEVSR